MLDYKKMYLHMVRESERAMDILVEAQLECERMYIDAPEPENTLLPPNKKEEDEPR